MKIVELSGCAIINESKILLLWKHKRSHYEFPGGKVEQGESYKEAAIREVREELGFIPKNLREWGSVEFCFDNIDLVSHIFLCDPPDEGTYDIQEKDVFDGLKWISLEKYQEYKLAENVVKFLKLFLDRDSNK